MSNSKPNPIIENWLSQMTPAQFEQLEAMPVRRDMVALLTYLRDKRVTGTQSTGNLPLKAVREITVQFVNLPLLDETVGNIRTGYAARAITFQELDTFCITPFGMDMLQVVDCARNR